MWDPPLIGLAPGYDDYYTFLKSHIGPHHWSPEEAFRMKYPNTPQSTPLSVVSIILPQTAETIRSQALEEKCPSREWIVSRGEWEPLMEEFGTKLEAALETKGHPGAFIDFLPSSPPAQGSSEFFSNWSHRHIAYHAGLGTFGLSEGLITRRGKAVRITSLVVEESFSPTKKPTIPPRSGVFTFAMGAAADVSTGARFKRLQKVVMTKLPVRPTRSFMQPITGPRTLNGDPIF